MKIILFLSIILMLFSWLWNREDGYYTRLLKLDNTDKEKVERVNQTIPPVSVSVVVFIIALIVTLL